MIGLFTSAIAAQVNMSPIEVPYQALPAFTAYTKCVSAHLRSDPNFESPITALVRQAHRNAMGSCRHVRAEQLALGITAVGDRRTPVAPNFRNRADAQAAVGRAFDRFDSDFIVEEAPTEGNDAQD